MLGEGSPDSRDTQAMGTICASTCGSAASRLPGEWDSSESASASAPNTAPARGGNEQPYKTRLAEPRAARTVCSRCQVGASDHLG